MGSAGERAAQNRMGGKIFAMNIVAYLRVSGRGQVDGDGFPRQVEAIKAFCKAHGVYQIAAYTEQMSGTVDGLDRPEFAKIIQWIDNNPGHINAVAVERMDRIARDLLVQELLLTELRKRGVKVFAADQGALIDMASNDGDPTRVLIRQILGALAQWEKTMLVRKLRSARERAIARGDYVPGRDPFGSRPGERVVLNLMLEQRAEGKNFSQIARYMNALDTKNRSGGRWKPQNVRDILLNHKPKTQE